MKPCDNACPSLDSFEAVQAQNWGCLPDPFEISQLLEQKQVWMCHSDRTRPCVATGLSHIPEGYTPVTE